MPVLSEDQLRALETGAVSVAAPTKSQVPDPEPEVIARAQEIYQELKTDKTPKPEDTISDADKVAFLAHILEGVPYKKSYNLFNDNMLLTFSTVSSALQDLVHSVCAAEERADVWCTAENRVSRYNSLIACLSICSIDGVADHKYKLNPSKLTINFDEWASLKKRISSAELAVVKQQYAIFAEHVSELIRRAEDPSFWQTRALE